MLRFVWVCEFQKRGVPHFHFIVYFPTEQNTKNIKEAWLAVSKHYRVLDCGVSCQKIHNLRGYYEYMAKHTARGINHYQRQKQNMPPEWQGQMPKMWGYNTGGAWPVNEDIDITALPLFATLRRIVRYKEIARVRHIIVEAIGSSFAYWNKPRAQRKLHTFAHGVSNIAAHKKGRALVASVNQFKGAWKQITFFRGQHKHTIPRFVFTYYKKANKPIPKKALKEYSKRRSGSLFCPDADNLFSAALSVVVFRSKLADNNRRSS